MRDVRGKYVSPAIDEVAFNCPHCGALARQYWFAIYVGYLAKDTRPAVLKEADIEEVSDRVQEPAQRARMKAWAERMAKGRPFLEPTKLYVENIVHNVSISRCFSCEELCVWLYDKLLWPSRLGGPQPNSDLPDEVRRDYEEASTILDASPRGAAALLRLALQKLCKELGESGKNINEDIASLVRKGLDPRVQKALDVVRVVGNDAVHPGKIDLRDDRATAETLFGLVNLICEKMITEPKHVDAIYEKLPEEKRKAIEERDTPKGETS